MDLNGFYKKRHMKILPFFAFLMLIDVAMNRSVSCIIEALTQATLVFTLLPNNQPEVIGGGAGRLVLSSCSTCYSLFGIALLGQEENCDFVWNFSCADILLLGLLLYRQVRRRGVYSKAQLSVLCTIFHREVTAISTERRSKNLFHNIDGYGLVVA